MANTPPRVAMPYFQMKTMAPPATMPASAPCLLARFQKRARSITGPKAAPKPAQAKDTMPKTELSGSWAMKTAMMAMMTMVPRATSIFFLAESLTPKNSATRF